MMTRVFARCLFILLPCFLCRCVDSKNDLSVSTSDESTSNVIESTSNAIVNGRSVDVGEYAAVVSIKYKRDWEESCPADCAPKQEDYMSDQPELERCKSCWQGWCTGTLIRDDVVLTAAHCVEFGKNEDTRYAVVFGSNVGDVNVWSKSYAPINEWALNKWVWVEGENKKKEKKALFLVRDAVVHPRAPKSSFFLFLGYDLAVLKLEQSVNGSDSEKRMHRIKPIKVNDIPMSSSDIGKAAAIIGYGYSKATRQWPKTEIVEEFVEHRWPYSVGGGSDVKEVAGENGEVRLLGGNRLFIRVGSSMGVGKLNDEELYEGMTATAGDSGGPVIMYSCDLAHAECKNRKESEYVVVGISSFTDFNFLKFGFNFSALSGRVDIEAEWINRIAGSP